MGGAAAPGLSHWAVWVQTWRGSAWRGPVGDGRAGAGGRGARAAARRGGPSGRREPRRDLWRWQALGGRWAAFEARRWSRWDGGSGTAWRWGGGRKRLWRKTPGAPPPPKGSNNKRVGAARRGPAGFVGAQRAAKGGPRREGGARSGVGRGDGGCARGRRPQTPPPARAAGNGPRGACLFGWRWSMRRLGGGIACGRAFQEGGAVRRGRRLRRRRPSVKPLARGRGPRPRARGPPRTHNSGETAGGDAAAQGLGGPGRGACSLFVPGGRGGGGSWAGRGRCTRGRTGALVRRAPRPPGCGRLEKTGARPGRARNEPDCRRTSPPDCRRAALLAQRAPRLGGGASPRPRGRPLARRPPRAGALLV
jgi:hypothetical protein